MNDRAFSKHLQINFKTTVLLMSLCLHFFFIFHLLFTSFSLFSKKNWFCVLKFTQMSTKFNGFLFVFFCYYY